MSKKLSVKGMSIILALTLLFSAVISMVPGIVNASDPGLQFPRIYSLQAIGSIGSHLDANGNVVIDDQQKFDRAASVKLLNVARPDQPGRLAAPTAKEIIALRNRAKVLGNNDIKIITMGPGIYINYYKAGYTVDREGNPLVETKAWADAHESYFLHDYTDAGAAAYNYRIGCLSGYPDDVSEGYFLCNIKDPACKAYEMGLVTKFLNMTDPATGTPVYNGICLDGIGFGRSDGGSPYVAEYGQVFPADGSGTQWRTDWDNFIVEMRATIGDDKIIIPNANIGVEDPVNNKLNGINAEYIFPPDDTTNWPSSFEFLRARQENLYLPSAYPTYLGLDAEFFGTTCPSIIDDPANPPKSQLDVCKDPNLLRLVRFGLATSCILNTTFSFSHVHDSVVYWFPEYNSGLGNPNGPYVLDTSGQTDFYRRDFSNGLVLLNKQRWIGTPTPSVNYTLPAGFDYKLDSPSFDSVNNKYNDFTIYKGGTPVTVTCNDAMIFTKVRYTIDNATNINTSGWTYTYPDDTREYMNDLVWTSVNNVDCTYTFKGTGIELFGNKGSSNGNISISIDGGAPVTASEYAAATQFQQSIWSITDLAYKTHTIKIKKTSGTYANVDFFKVYDWSTLYDGKGVMYKSGNGTTGWAQATDPNVDHGSDIYTSDTGAPLTYRFNGTGIEVMGNKYYIYGKMRINIDGTQYPDVDCYSATTQYNQSLLKVTNLTNGQHVIKIEAAPGPYGSFIDFDCFRVY